jgi:hypothetical protein
MVYTYISSRVCIARVFDRYNIDYSGFIPRVPNWIYNAMSQLELPITLHNKTVVSQVVDYKCIVPPETKIINGISYENKRLYRIGGINEKDATTMGLLIHANEKYELSNGYIITTFETGEVTFYIQTLPVEFDSKLNLYFPLLPNNETLLNALDSFILMRLLERGHKVNDFNLKEGNPFMNPALTWNNSKQAVKNSITALDHDSRHEISMMLRSFIDDYSNYSTVSFNPNIIAND